MMIDGRAMTLAAAAVGAALLIGPGQALGPTAAQAQSRDWINPDVVALREEVAALRQEVARLSGVDIDPNALAALGGDGASSVRIDQIEAELRRLVGSVEQLTFRQEAIERRLGLSPNAGAPVSSGQFGASAPAGVAAAAPLTGAPGAGPAPAGAPRAGQTIGGAASPGEATSGVLGSLGGDGAAPGGPAVVDTPKFDNPAAATAPAAAPAAPAGAVSGATFDEGLDLLRRNDIEGAAQRFEAFAAAAPNDPRAGDAIYWLGETFFARGDYTEAARNFLRVFREYREADRAPDSLLKLGMSLARLNKVTEACRTLAEVRNLYPNATPTVLRRAELEINNAGCT